MERVYERGDERLKVVARPGRDRIDLEVDGATESWHWEEITPGEYLLRRDGRLHRVVVADQGAERWIWVDGHVHHFTLASFAPRRRAARGGSLAAPMNGVVLKVLVRPGDAVQARQPLVVLEAMKLQYDIVAPRDGRVAAVHVAEGALVNGGTELVALAELPATPEDAPVAERNS